MINLGGLSKYPKATQSISIYKNSYTKPSNLSSRLDGLFNAGINNDSILLTKYYDEYVEDILVYLVGVLHRKYEIIGEEEQNNRNSIISLFQLIIVPGTPSTDYNARLTNEDVTFMYSVVFKRIFDNKALTTKQYDRIKKIFNNNEGIIKNYIGDKLYSDLFLDKFFIDLEKSVYFNREISFIGSGLVGIQFAYDAVIHTKIKNLKNASYNHEHKIWILSLSDSNIEFIEYLRDYCNFAYCSKLELIMNNINMFDEVSMSIDCDEDYTISYGSSRIASTFEVALSMNEE